MKVPPEGGASVATKSAPDTQGGRSGASGLPMHRGSTQTDKSAAAHSSVHAIAVNRTNH